MAQDGEGQAESLPPPSEEIHLPGPSYAPAVAALGIAVALIGVVFSFIMTFIGALIFLVPTVRWIRDAREEMAELPVEQ